MLTLSFCLILASHLAGALLDDPNTVFVRENGTAKLHWTLFIGENAGLASVLAMIKKRDTPGTPLCQWVKLRAHGEDNHCDRGMSLTITPEHMRVPGPTNITATFSFKNKGRVDDGIYECRFVIDEKWHEMQVYPRYLVTTVEPNVTLNATYSNTCITDIICHVRGGRPKPVETILMKNGTEKSRSSLKCHDDADETDDSEASYCSSVHSVENSGGQYKCRVEHAGYVVDSAEVDIPFRTQGSHLAATLQDDPHTVFVPENGPVALRWSLFIGENAGRSSVNVMIKKRDALLCQWVKAHGELNQCVPGIKLTINPKHVRVPGPTNITATFSFKNKGRVDDGVYECRLVIDEKWHEMRVYPRYLVTTVEPNVTLNATYSNTCITNIICHVRGGRPKPVETILMKNGTEISRSSLKCQDDADETDDNEASYCSSVHSVENSGGQFKCRVEHADYFVDSSEVDIPLRTQGGQWKCKVEHAEYVVDSAEVDIPFRTKENETSAPWPGMNYDVYAANTLVNVIVILTSIIFVLIVFVMVLVYLILRQRRKHQNVTVPGR